MGSTRPYDCEMERRTAEKALVPCEGGPCDGLGFLVEQPVPLEIQRDGGGIYVLEERGDPAEPELVYVFIES
jgi:hypothetical protein